MTAFLFRSRRAVAWLDDEGALHVFDPPRSLSAEYCRFFTGAEP